MNLEQYIHKYANKQEPIPGQSVIVPLLGAHSGSIGYFIGKGRAEVKLHNKAMSRLNDQVNRLNVRAKKAKKALDSLSEQEHMRGTAKFDAREKFWKNEAENLSKDRYKTKGRFSKYYTRNAKGIRRAGLRGGVIGALAGTGMPLLAFSSLKKPYNRKLEQQRKAREANKKEEIELLFSQLKSNQLPPK